MKHIVAVLLALAASGCALVGMTGSAQERKAENGVGGIIAIKGNRDKAMAQAKEWMAERCGSAGYRIVSEEEVVIGSTNLAWAGGSNPTEHRVNYACGTAPASAAPAVTEAKQPAAKP
jgi:hypothetical protein